jgi:hypothetical protein
LIGNKKHRSFRYIAIKRLLKQSEANRLETAANAVQTNVEVRSRKLNQLSLNSQSDPNQMANGKLERC